MNNKSIATFGAGCFWCVEAVFQDLEGVQQVISGYEGGKTKNPTYKEICTGTTGHAEVIQVVYDPNVVTYETLLEVFFITHDPTTLNRQGNDRGTQYRSAIFYHNDDQKRLAEAAKIAAEQTGVWHNPIVTEIAPTTVFYPAENYHQNFYKDNESYPYCIFVVAPKVQKFRKEFKERLKKL
jgi:peptide-methionine (S)-S-oxide reductase